MAPRTIHMKVDGTMPHFLAAILTNVAIAVIEAALIRLSMALWKAFLNSGRPAAAYA